MSGNILQKQKIIIGGIKSYLHTVDVWYHYIMPIDAFYCYKL